jgi:hypothetical protein
MLSDPEMTAASRLNTICQTAAVIKSKVDAIVKEDYSTSAANAKDLVVAQQGLSSHPVYVETLGKLVGITDSASILDILIESKMQCVTKTMVLSKAPEADPIAKKVMENMTAFPTYLSRKVMSTAPDSFGIIPYRPATETVAALKKFKFNEVPWHLEVYALFIGTTPGARVHFPTAPPSLTLVPNWQLHMVVIERLLLAMGVPEETTDHLSGYLQVIASSSYVPASLRNAPVERILASFMDDLTQHMLATTAQTRSANALPELPVSPTTALFRAYVDSAKAVLIREQSISQSVSVDIRDAAEPPAAKRQKQGAEPKNKGPSAMANTGMGSKADVVAVSSNKKYLKIGKSFYDLEAYKKDGLKADTKFKLRPQLAQLAFVAGNKQRKLQFLKKQPLTADIEAAMMTPFKGFSAANYKLDEEPQDF